MPHWKRLALGLVAGLSLATGGPGLIAHAGGGHAGHHQEAHHEGAHRSAVSHPHQGSQGSYQHHNHRHFNGARPGYGGGVGVPEGGVVVPQEVVVPDSMESNSPGTNGSAAGSGT